jgi:hypothetical protein
MPRMAEPPVVMTFPDLDTAESALDWIGLMAAEGGDGTTGWFEGELTDDDIEALDEAWTAGDTPQAVKALAGVLRDRAGAGGPTRAWRVTFPA